MQIENSKSLSSQVHDLQGELNSSAPQENELQTTIARLTTELNEVPFVISSSLRLSA